MYFFKTHAFLQALWYLSFGFQYINNISTVETETVEYLHRLNL